MRRTRKGTNLSPKSGSMLQTKPDDKLSKTVLDFLTQGAYPESEEVAAAKFPASAPPVALEHISKAREEAEVFAHSPLEHTGLN